MRPRVVLSDACDGAKSEVTQRLKENDMEKTMNDLEAMIDATQEAATKCAEMGIDITKNSSDGRIQQLIDRAREFCHCVNRREMMS